MERPVLAELEAGPSLDTGEPPALRRELGRLDAICLLVTAIVAIDLIGAVANGGPQSLTWLAVVAALFFVPAGLVVSELGSAFPDEGGAYVWARRAFGRTVGAVAAWFYWFDTPVWLGGSLAILCVTVVDDLVIGLEGPARWAVALAFVWLVVAAAVVPLRRAKWLSASGALAQVVLLAAFTVTVALYALDHGVHGVGAGGFVPGWAGLLAVAPVLVYGFLGFELPSSAAGEMRDPRRDVPAAVGRAGALTVLLYGIPILAILVVVPEERITSLSGFLDAIASVFTVYGGEVRPDGTVALDGAGSVLAALIGLCFVWSLLATGLAWVMASARSLAVAAIDGAAPAALGRFSLRTGTPVTAVLLTGLLASATSAAAFAVAGDDGDRYFSVVLTVAIALLAVANVLVFPALVVLRRRHPHAPRPFRVPGGAPGAWLASGLATGWCVLALAAAVVPAALPAGFEGERPAFTACVAIPLLVLGAVAVAVSTACARRRRTALTPVARA
jgi:amino acid transporter